MLSLFLGTSNATYGMWFPGDKLNVVINLPPMVVFSNFSAFYDDLLGDLIKRDVKVRLLIELVIETERGKNDVRVKLKNRTPMPDDYNPASDDPDAPE